MINSTNNNSQRFKLNEFEKKKLLDLDKEYGELVDMYRHDRNTKDVVNLDEECEKFLNARKRGIKYFPYIKLDGENKFYTDGILLRLKNLLHEFLNFNCYLSKYYIELLRDMITAVEVSFDIPHLHPRYTAMRAQTPSLENYTLALQMLKENPYQEVDTSDRTISGKKAAKIIQQHIDKLGYKWKVLLNKNIIPRMNVDVNKTMNVNPKAKFSEVDLEGLKKHEVEGHVARRYYGLKTGLNLFCLGLRWRNTLDEGLAIWNSLHKCKKVKPNVKFNIALKTIIAYHLCDMDFCELFDMCKKLAPNMPDESLFATLIRFKREFQDTSIKGGNGDDQSYFCGYQLVKKMDWAQRDDILKWNIGPDQIKDLPDIKQFFKVNKFESLI